MRRTASPFGIGVYRTRDKGKTWEKLEKGLPQGAPMEALREGMHNDRLDPMGLYFGTANGDVWASRDEGESWTRIAPARGPALNDRGEGGRTSRG
jgi:photosystem II stability/assembly factor-like uncharacterized protein